MRTSFCECESARLLTRRNVSLLTLSSPHDKVLTSRLTSTRARVARHGGTGTDGTQNERMESEAGGWIDLRQAVRDVARAFQREHRLKVHGIVSLAAWERLVL